METSLLQVKRIQRYLQDVETYLDDLPPEARRDELTRLRPRIEKDLTQIQDSEFADQEICRLMRRIDTPQPQPFKPKLAALPMSLQMPALVRPANWQIPAWARPDTWERPDWVRPVSLSNRNVEWLGVSAGIAEHFGWNPFFVRVAAVTAGLFTGPLALIAYALAFAIMSVATPREFRPRVKPLDFFVSVAATLASAFAIYAVAQTFIVVTLHVFGSVLSPAEATLDPSWTWYAIDSGRWLSYALVATLPLAVLGGLPLAHRWDGTLAKMAQAGLALYGMLACFGVASLFVGVLIQIVQQTSGVVLAPV